MTTMTMELHNCSCPWVRPWIQHNWPVEFFWKFQEIPSDSEILSGQDSCQTTFVTQEAT